MAITSQESVEFANVYSTTPVISNTPAEWHGRLRVATFSHVQVGAGDATSSVALCRLPAGRVRVLAALSHAHVNWTTASATLDLGWDTYTDPNGDPVAADSTGFDDGLDVDAPGKHLFGSRLATSGYSKLFQSLDGVVLRATAQDGPLADGDSLTGAIVYVLD